MGTCFAIVGLLVAILPNYALDSLGFSEQNDEKTLEISNEYLNENEYYNYCIENKVFSMNTPDPSTIGEIKEENISTHLNGRFTGYSNWQKVSSLSNTVATTYGGEPIEVDESDPDIQTAKTQAGITSISIGCGPLASICQLDYLARFAGYTNLEIKNDYIIEETTSSAYYNLQHQEFNDYKISLAREVMENTPTISGDSWLGQQLGLNPADTLTFPRNFVKGVNTVLANHHYATPKIGYDNNNQPYTYFDSDSTIYATGNDLPLTILTPVSTRIADIKNSIDNGLPVVWWTLGEMGFFSNHYMNIYAYEIWRGIDQNSNIYDHLLFKLRLNWGKTYDVYMDSDILDSHGYYGLIYFHETREKTTLLPRNYGLPCAYNNSTDTKAVGAQIGRFVILSYLRMGYVHHYNSSNTINDMDYLVLSSRRDTAGTAYAEYTTTPAIHSVAFDLAYWGPNEDFSSNDIVELQYWSSGWITAINLHASHSIQLTHPYEYYYEFPDNVHSFRIYNSSSAIGSTNKGRISLGSMSIFYQ